ASGIEDVILIINPAHRNDFASYLRGGGKKFPFRFAIREQSSPGGNGHAVVQAFDLLDGPVAIRFCDDIIVSEEPVTRSLIELFDSVGSSALLLERVPQELVSRFGVIKPEKTEIPDWKGGRVMKINKIVEKPRLEDAPSNLTIVGGYVLTPRTIANLKAVADVLPVIADDALPIAVGIQMELAMGSSVYGWEFDGKRLDCGTLESLKKAEEELKNLGKR
ncbi:MAG: sugar phosphate nucleotidyltransferase, partial [Armatimonadota bacterium]|nr:sugar phosphate nucleotidyltransferase [Armatimonadota bacterium]